ncbi:MAG: EamA family transporter RarD [Ilumatobacter sp.]|nr:EamA family transporter RarD [Ilumatobacter sp.]
MAIDRPADSVDSAVARGVRVGFAAYTIWGFLTIYWKQLSAFGAIELIGWRMLTAAVVMAALTTVRGNWAPLVVALRDRGTQHRLVAAALLLTVNWGSYVWAVVNDRVIETALGYFIAPLATMGIGVLVLHERATGAQRFAFVCSSCAVVILTISYGHPPWIALVLAATWSLYGLSKRRIPLGPVAGLTGETLVLCGPALAIVAISSTRAGSVVASADAAEWGFALGTGLITAIPLVMFASAAQSIPFTLLGPLNLLVPVINFGLGWALFDEPMPAARFVGFAFVWVALVAVMSDRVRRGRGPSPAIPAVT